MSIYLAVGHPVTDHIFSTGCSEGATWEVTGDLPPGVTFDAQAPRFVGTPTTDVAGSFEVRATDFRGTGLFEGSFEVVNTAVTVTGPDSSPVDLTAVALGAELEVHGFADDRTTVDVLWDGESVSRASGTGVFTREISVPGTANRGTHVIDVVFEPSEGQSYTTRVTVTVFDLELIGPSAIFPIVGVNTSYSYVGLGAREGATYQLDGELPAGMSFDAAMGILAGTPQAVSRSNVVIYVLDGDREDGIEVAIDVRSAASVQFPAITTTPDLGFDLTALTGLLEALGSAGDDVTQSEIDELLEQRQHAAASSGPRMLLPGLDPATGESTITFGSRLENQKEQNRLLAEAAQRAAEKAKQEQLKALEEERKRRAQAEKDKQELLKVQNDMLQKKLKEQLEKQKAANEKAAEDARKRAEEAYKAKLKNEAAREALEKRKQELEQRTEPNPLPAGTTVRAELHSTPILLAQTTVPASGGFLIRTHIPTGTSPGAHHLVVSYTLPDGTVHTQSMAITVIDPNALPATGADLAPIGYAGGSLLVLGLAATLLARRERRHQAATTRTGSEATPFSVL